LPGNQTDNQSFVIASTRTGLTDIGCIVDL